ncbi:TolC family protein [Herbaspirillum sp. RV1423]|uniref:TolC family protein n=1 Tax=Herbaspirillum sp. RV1423 TaxID=1443993 RepID=UPI0006852D1A|nr:TolC family protein [Herbaspirillum sp. RV1423]
MRVIPDREGDAAQKSAAQPSPAELAARAEASANSNDEILALLRQSDPSFSGSAIDLPPVQVETVDDLQVPFLTLDQVLDLALNNSYSYAATAAQADQARYASKASLGQMGPTLDVRTQKGKEYSSPASFRDENGNIVQADSHKRWDATLIGRQPIFAPGSYFDYQKQRAMSQAADLRRDDARESLYYSVIKAYYDVLRAYASLSFARSYAKRMDELLEYMRKRLEGGGASKIDFERVRGRSLQAQATIAESEGTLESTLVTLTQLIGRRVQQVQVPARMMPAVPPTSRVALQDVLESNAGIRAARSDTDAVREELKSARAKFTPTFAVEWSQAKTRGAGGDQTLQTDRRLMLVMTMNLLNGGSDAYYQSQIGAKLVEKSNTAADLERKLKEQIEINYRTLGAVRKRMDISREAYETNAKVADVFLEQLSTGSKQLLDVLDAYQQAYQARMDFALLLFQQADISYQILRNTGRAWTPSGDQSRNGK